MANRTKQVQQFIYDDDGYPMIVLADVLPSGVSKVDSNAKSGNPRHDTRSGKFGTGSSGPKGKAPQAPANVDPLEQKRMEDAARDLAREFDIFGEDDVKEFLAGRAKNPERVDIAAFIQMAQEQRKDDIVDILDKNLRANQLRRKVKVIAPKGWIRKSLKGLDADDVTELIHRLEARGHKPEDIDAYFGRNVSQDTVKKARESPITASDQWQADPIPWDENADLDEETAPFDMMAFSQEFATQIVKSLPQPIINVHMPPPTRTKVVPVRDNKGLIIHTITEQIED